MNPQNLLPRIAALSPDAQSIIMSAMRHALDIAHDEQAQDWEAQLDEIAAIATHRLAALRPAA